jgi:hypothetical protein
MATYATWNPSDKGSAVTLSGGDLTYSSGTWVNGGVRSTIGKASGKWYWENVVNSGANAQTGIGLVTVPLTENPGGFVDAYQYQQDGQKETNATQSAYGSSYTTGDTIGIALDMDAGTITFYKNNVSQGVAFSGLSGTFYAMEANQGSVDTVNMTANFGATAQTYAPPSGFHAGLGDNLPDVTSIKTINGLVKASVKVINGLAIASVKNWNGLA